MKRRILVLGSLMGLLLSLIGGMVHPIVAVAATPPSFSAAVNLGGPGVSQSGPTAVQASLNSGLIVLGGGGGFARVTFSSQAAANAGPDGLRASARSTGDSELIPSGFVNSVTPFGEGHASADFHDIVISGPPGGAAAVPGSLNLHVSGTVSATAQDNPDYCACDIGADVKVGLAGNLSGLTFSGTKELRSDGTLTQTGIFAGFPGSGGITTPEGMLPVGTSLDLHLELGVQALAFLGGTVYLCGANPCGVGSSSHADGLVDFSHTVTFATSGPVFNLLPGYTVNAPSAGIVDNQFVGSAAAGTHLAFTATSPSSGDFNDPVTVSATLTNASTSAAIPGQPVVFQLDSQPACTGTTDSTGIASCALTPNEPAGTSAVTASFAGGGGGLLPSSARADFAVTLEEAKLTSSANAQVFPTNGATLTAALTDPTDHTPIAGKPVTLTLGSGSDSQSCAATTDASGVALCTISPVTVPLGAQPITDSFGGDQFYQPASNKQQALVFAFPASGAFVLGDQSASGSVTFWSAQWATSNALSGGAAPDSFKGFADTTPEPPACGANWTAHPANSSAPPNSVPAYMGVIVADAVTQSGAVITGDAPHIVVVATAPGYAPDPGHPGTGTVVAQYC